MTCDFAPSGRDNGLAVDQSGYPYQPGQPEYQPYPGGQVPPPDNRVHRVAATWSDRLARVFLRTQLWALALGIGFSLVSLLWASGAPTAAEIRDLAATVAPLQEAGEITEPSWTEEPIGSGALRLALADRPEPDAPNATAVEVMGNAGERLREAGWTVRGYADADGVPYVEAVRDGRLTQVFPTAVLLKRDAPAGTALMGQIGLVIGAIIGVLTGIGRRGAVASASATILRVALALGLLLPSMIAIVAVTSGQPLAGYLGTFFTAIMWSLGITAFLGGLGVLFTHTRRR